MNVAIIKSKKIETSQQERRLQNAFLPDDRLPFRSPSIWESPFSVGFGVCPILNSHGLNARHWDVGHTVSYGRSSRGLSLGLAWQGKHRLRGNCHEHSHRAGAIVERDALLQAGRTYLFGCGVM